MSCRILVAAAVAWATFAGAVSGETLAVRGARIHTLGPDGVVDKHVLLVRDGRIVAVGRDIDVPVTATRIEGRGRELTPGLFDAYGYLGLVEVSLEPTTVDVAHVSTHFAAGFDIADAINPRSTLIPITRIEGVTRAVVAPATMELGSPFAGLGAVIHLGDPETFLIQRRAALFVQLGEAGSALAGGSRAAALLRLRELLEDARDFGGNRAAWAEKRRRDYAAPRYDLDAVQPVLDRRIPLVVTVHRASDIEAVARLADEFSIRVVIAGGAEAWLVADALARANIAVILDPMANLPSAFERLGSRLDNAALLHAAGVSIAFSTSDSHNARNLRQAAGVAVANGLPFDAALAAMTVNPARMFGQQERYGSIEVGKEADFVIWSGDPLEVTTFAEQVFIRGVSIPMVSRQTLLRERHLSRDRRAPAYRNP